MPTFCSGRTEPQNCINILEICTSDKSTFVLSDVERFQMFADIVASKQLNSNYVIFKEKKPIPFSRPNFSRHILG